MEVLPTTETRLCTAASQPRAAAANAVLLRWACSHSSRQLKILLQQEPEDSKWKLHQRMQHLTPKWADLSRKHEHRRENSNPATHAVIKPVLFAPTSSRCTPRHHHGISSRHTLESKPHAFKAGCKECSSSNKFQTGCVGRNRSYAAAFVVLDAFNLKRPRSANAVQISNLLFQCHCYAYMVKSRRSSRRAHSQLQFHRGSLAFS